MKKYIITEDLEFLMRSWVQANKFMIPGGDFFQQLSDELKQFLETMFEEVIIIPQKDISVKIKEEVVLAKTISTVVSLDRIYNSADYHLETNRIADKDTSDVIGEAERPGSPKLPEQIEKLPKGEPITLVDDGMFSGETMLGLCNLLEEKGLKINKIIVGLNIEPGENVLFKKRSDIAVFSVFNYENVIDWVCERDFYLGVPYSGRTAGFKKNGRVQPLVPGVSLPYCYPFGNPVKCASIPEVNAENFSKWMIRQSTRLWENIEEVSSKKIDCSLIPRLPYGLKRTDDFFVEVLKNISI